MTIQIFTQRSIAFLGNYLPRQCGLATFTTDLRNAIAAELDNQRETFVVAMTNRPEGYEYPDCVRFEINQHQIRTYEQAADFINTSKVDVLCIQHEYGIFGGKWGNFLLRLMRRVKVPIVITLHTVLGENRGQKSVLQEIIKLSERVVVLNNRAREMLRDEVGKKAKDKVVVIPHGIPDLPFVDSNYYKDKFNVMGRKVLLTFGLLSPGKGIEYVIEALPDVVKKYPDIVYIVLGVTHPEVKKLQGEEYRFKLLRKVEALGLEKHVLFHNRFVEIEELCEFLCSADIYVTPYLNKEQIISGTLAYSVGAGKAVISTPIWCAEEMLADERGYLVPFRDASGFAKKINYLLGNEIELHAMRKRAYLYGRSMVWREVARQYLNMFEKIQGERRVVTGTEWEKKVATISATEFPEPNLEQLRVLTDNFALYQHATFTVPSYEHGYTVDDNTRALVVAMKHYRLYDDLDSLNLLRKYISFVLYAQNDNGTFRNVYSIDRKPCDDVGSDDCQGRALWGLGYIIAYAPDYFWMVAKNAFDKAFPQVEKLNLRGSAFAALGIYYYLRRYPGALHFRSALRLLATRIVEHYQDSSTGSWLWYEKVLTYSNGVLPTALWMAYSIFQDKKYYEIAEKTTLFLVDKCTKDKRISLIGCKGWIKEHDSYKADFDQQPIDAMWLVQLAKTAFTVTNDDKYLILMRNAYDWFLGANDLGVSMYDFITGGCYDGLTPSGPNVNQGAESTVSCLLALLDIIEMSQK